MARVVGFHPNPELRDWASLYASASAWRTGLPMAAIETTGNLNPPTLDVLLAPFTLLSSPAAFALWACLSALLCLATWRLIGRELHWSAGQTMSVAAVVLALSPALGIFAEGQPTWLLIYAVSQGWVNRHAPWVAAGWLSAACLLKPPLALMVLLLPVAYSSRTALIGTVATGGLVGLLGWPVWADWIARGRDVTWIDWPANASLWGVAARLEHGQLTGTATADLSGLTVAAIALVLIALAAWTVRQSPASRWTLAACWCALASPIGWTTYVLVGLLPALVAWPTGWHRHAAIGTLVLALVTIPLWSRVEVVAPDLSLLWRSMQAVLVLVALVAWARREKTGSNLASLVEQ
jgi:hypothetical protein